MTERIMVHAWKVCVAKNYREFESHSNRQFMKEKCRFCGDKDLTDTPYGVCYECGNIGPKFLEFSKKCLEYPSGSLDISEVEKMDSLVDKRAIVDSKSNGTFGFGRQDLNYPPICKKASI